MHGDQRHIPVHRDGVLSVQMQVQLFDFPGAVLCRELRHHRRIICQRHAVLHHICAEPVRAVAVLAVDVMRNDNLRLVPAQQFHGKFPNVALAPAGVGVFQLSGIGIIELADHRIGAHTHRPQAVEQLAAASGIGIRHVRYDDIHTALGIVRRYRTAKENQLVVRVSGKHQHVRLFRGRLPALDPFRKLARREDVKLVDLELRVLSGGIDQTEMRLAAELKEHMMIVISALDQRLPFAVHLFLDRPGLGHIAEADVQILRLFALRRGELNIRVTLLAAAEIAGVLTVVQAGGIPARRRRAACFRNVAGSLRNSAGRAGAQHQHQRKDNRNLPLHHLFTWQTYTGSPSCRRRRSA